MTTAPEIFKAYDVRGIHGEQLDGDGAERIGRGFARVIGHLAGKAPSDCRIGLGRVHAQHQGGTLSLRSAGQHLHTVDTLFCRELGVLARELRPDDSMHAAFVEEARLGREILEIDSLGGGVGRRHDDEDAAHRLSRCG